MSRVTLPQQQTLSLRAALAIVLSVFLAVSFALYLVDGQGGYASSVLAAENEDDAADDGATGEIEEVAVVAPLSTIPLSLGRDPFEPVRPTPPPATPAADTSNDNDDGGTGGGDDTNDDDTSGDDTSTGGTTVKLVEVRSDSAVVEVAGTSHDVMVGEVFAEEYRLLRVLGECAEIQRGDQVLPVLCVGEQTSK